MAEVELYKFINALNISDGWKRNFKLIHLVYHQNYYDGSYKSTLSWTSMPEISTMHLRDKLKFFCTFNIFALIFGPFYYLVKGMYKKGALLLAVIWLLHSFNNITACFIPFIMIHCAIFANIDYFVLKVLNNPQIMSNISILGDSFDQKHFDSIAEGKNPRPLLVPFIILLYAAIILHMGFGVYDSFRNTQALNKPPNYCANADCTSALAKNTEILKSGKGKRYISEYKIASIYNTMGDKKNALKYADDSIRHSPKHTLSYLLRASLYMDSGEFNRAIDDYRAALRLDKKLLGANYQIGRCYYKQKKYPNALTHFTLATKRYPFNAPYFEMQGYTKVYLRNIAGAKKDLNRAAFLYMLNIAVQDRKRSDTVRRYIEML